ncbi:glycosyltransferase family 2 protein [Qiania dongpingensis]|uniref:Glycosyltransferase n=1 Tax=Qiania dongpingensis TaxID=2763669 RepID=A0A7G9G7R9_9FIRM|nr:glycosyltransferase family 2 protein [Qiania dongpingensis]QNM06851.1 glycosyltransferase [Qiania dongpingensis]
MKKIKLSFVIPCYNSEKTISYVVDRIKNAFVNHNEYFYEIILVNDGSKDNTFHVIKNLAKENYNVTAIDLSKNFGQHSALMAGYASVSGDYIIGMDDDGEHDPQDLFKLVEKLEEGYDYVCADFENDNRSKLKHLGSKINDWMATKLVGKPPKAIFSSYYIMKRFIIDEIIKCKNPFPYVGGMIVSITKRLSSVPMERHTRKAGRSGYNLRNSFSLWLNGVTAFSIKPLRFAALTGSVMAIWGFLYGLYLVIKKLFFPDLLVGYASLMVALLVIGGILMITLGMIGEYIGRIYISLNNIPQYVVREIITKESEEKGKNEGE